MLATEPPVPAAVTKDLAGNPPDSGTPLQFKTSTPISLVGDDGAAMAHGRIMDNEPDVSAQKMCGAFVPGLYKKIDLLNIVRGWGSTVLQRDEIFDSDLQPFASKKRKLQELLNYNEGADGLYIWHEYVRPRIRAVQKKRAPNGSRKK